MVSNEQYCTSNSDFSPVDYWQIIIGDDGVLPKQIVVRETQHRLRHWSYILDIEIMINDIMFAEAMNDPDIQTM